MAPAMKLSIFKTMAIAELPCNWLILVGKFRCTMGQILIQRPSQSDFWTQTGMVLDTNLTSYAHLTLTS